MKDYQTMAAYLYDGGWRAEDAEDIQREYGLDDFDLAEIVAWLKEMED